MFYTPPGLYEKHSSLVSYQMMPNVLTPVKDCGHIFSERRQHIENSDQNVRLNGEMSSPPMSLQDM